ncbi:MAG: SusD/RagB family nutrient-binding outer membrane lipoprotein [Bacteroidetes bacterium]|nr:SusD/RagB family nutrient-binding outer membrane lipoprotein [Bacteroidota bacterium]MBL6962983.1 SusD/RagB family nutrient-binding outer membrane lipoprotein [Bacteroidota bacterium]
MKKILYLILVFLAVSCADLTDLNKDVKSPTDVPGNTLFSNALKNLSDQLASLNVNVSNFNLWSQYLTETTYTDEANYNIFARNVPDYAWREYYRDVLQDLNRAEMLIGDETPSGVAEVAAQANSLQIIEIVKVYTWDLMITLWGDIPYTEALDIDNVQPAYDDALTIHKDLIARVSAAITALDVANGSFGAADIIYHGDVAMWKAFANGLKVKMALQLADVASEAALVAASITAAAPGTFASSAENAVFNYLSGTPNTNPLYEDLTLSGRLDYVAANTLVDMMNLLNDPRISLYYDQNLEDSLGNVYYLGGDYGHSSAYGNYSHINTAISQDPTFGSALMTYSEIQFYLAEAAARISDPSASTYYDAAVTASIIEWGGTATDATTYLAQPAVAYNQGTWKDKIGTQAWISFYMRGYEGWTSWRRLDAPTMNMPPTPTEGGFPYRYTYPSGEQTLNGANYTAAASAVGGDYLATKLYWDKN